MIEDHISVTAFKKEYNTRDIWQSVWSRTIRNYSWSVIDFVNQLTYLRLRDSTDSIENKLGDIARGYD